MAERASVTVTIIGNSSGVRPTARATANMIDSSIGRANQTFTALDLETGKTAMIEVESVDAVSTIKLLEAIEAMYPLMAIIHVFLDNARYHHAVLVQEWLTQPGRRIKLHLLPTYSPHLNPIERLWGVMHKHLTHNKCWRDYRTFAETVL